MTSLAHRVFTKDEIKDFVTDLIKALDHAHKNNPAKETTSIDQHDTEIQTEAERRANDKAILRGELAREKRQHIKTVASDHTTSNKDLITALGGDSAVTNLQLARLVKADHPHPPKDLAEDRLSTASTDYDIQSSS